GGNGASARECPVKLFLFTVLATLILSAGGQNGAAMVEREIHGMEHRWNEARAKADVATLNRILVDDWTVTHNDGSTDTKARYLADLTSGARKFSGGVTESDVTIRVYGDTA